MNIPKKSGRTFAKRLLCISAFGLICSVSEDSKLFANSYTNNLVAEQLQNNASIKGQVVDKSGEPLTGVSVVAEGTTNGTFTDLDGYYTINANSTTTLVFSYIGFTSQKVVVGSKKVIDITLSEDSQMIDEVVVVGYGTQKKENLTGAVVSVDLGKTLESRPIADVGRGLQGAVAGLNVTIPSGEVGSDPIMKIRGQVGSINGTSNPLILVDNVEIPSIQMVNSNDIESISVLKDAASTSIYGSKGAFGVILITTKKGAKQESISVNYSNNFSWQKSSKDIDMGMLDAVEYSVLAAERIGSTKTGAFWIADRASYERSKEWLQKYGGSVGNNDPILYGRDWYMDGATKMGVRLYNAYDYMVEDWTPSQSHNLSVNGRSGKTSYNIGLGYLNQNGVMKPAKHDDFTRYNATVRLSTEINKYVTVRGGMMYSNRRKRYAYATNSTTADPWYYVYRWGPLSPYGSAANGQVLRSPASELANSNTAEQTYSYTNVNIGATVNLTKDWTIEADFTYANMGYDWLRPGTRFTAQNAWAGAIPWNNEDGSRIYVDEAGNIVSSTTPGATPGFTLPYTTYTAKGANPDHIYRRSENDKQSTSNVYTTYNLTLNDVHNFKFMAGLNLVKKDTDYSWAQRTTLMYIDNPQFDLATGTQTSSGGRTWESQLGYFGRVNYILKDRYLFEGNLRYDGSSKFPSHLQWRWFPSFSAGWIVTNESFMEKLDPIVSTLKLRGSWGSIGDQSVPNNLYVPLMNQFAATSRPGMWINGSDKVTGYTTPLAAYRDIGWQDIQNLDLGFDLRLLNNRLGITYDWYQRTTKNMITQGIDLPYSYGGPVPQGNFGELRTRGWEIAVDFNHRFSNGIGINLMATLADATSVITNFPDEASKNIISQTANYKGKRWGDIWGYKTDRLFQESDFDKDANGNWVLKPGIASQKGLNYSSNFVLGPGDVKFVDINGDGEINSGSGVEGDSGDMVLIGNSTPRYEYGFRLGSDYKGFDVSVFFQGVGQRKIWGNGVLAIPGYNSADGAMPQTFAGDFWREDRTDAFYPRPYNIGASAANMNNMQVQDRYLLNMAYLRLKNITVGYTLSPQLAKKAYLTNARIYVSAENFFTFDKLRGLPIDPEMISGYSMFDTSNYNSGRTGVGAPTFKSLSFGIQLTF